MRQSSVLMRQLFLQLLVLLLSSACDTVGRENARGSAVPQVEPPRLSPVAIKPPRIERSLTSRVKVVDPPRADATQVDVMLQSDGVVDILWVVDDSGSMANERKRLQANFSNFLATLLSLKVDFHMGVSSIVYADAGRLRGRTKILTNDTPEPHRVFEENTTFAASRSRWEQGLRMTEFALTPPNTDPDGFNSGFLRQGAALAIIVVTNEDDSSFGTADHYARIFRGLKGKGNENLVSFSVIGGALPNGCTSPDEASFYGSLAEPAFRYAEVAGKTGGVVGSICDASFEQTLTRIAQALNTLKRIFPLTLQPVSNSITVTVLNGAATTQVPNDLMTGFQYQSDTNSIAFLGTFIPPPGSTVRIEYAFSKE